MSELYDEDERKNSVSASVPKPVSAAQLEDIPPDQLTTITDNSRLAIIEQTKLLSHKLKQCEQIVLNAYRVSDFVPNCDTPEQEQTWKGTITPILLQTINEDVVARWVMTDSFSAIRVLAITIQGAYEIVRTTKGSPEAIEIAKQRIPKALKKIDNCIKRAEKLTDNGMKQFNANTKIIMDIAGPEVAKKVMDLAQYEDNINKALEKENNFLVNLYKAKGDEIRYKNLMDVVDNKRDEVKKEIAEIESQKNELSDMNKEIDKRIQNIPQKVTEKRTVKSTESVLWRWFSRTSTTVVEEELNNPNKVSDQNYYESVINARASRIAKADGTANAKKAVLKDLDDQYDRYEKNYRDALATAKAAEDTKVKTSSEIDDTIQYNRKKIEKTREEAACLETKFGHNGQTLVDCLTHVKAFGQSLKDGTSAYAPIYTILNDIKAMVRLQVKMLESSSPQLVFVAGKILMQQVQFLSKYNMLAIEAVKQSQGYNEVSKAIDPKIEMLAIK